MYSRKQKTLKTKKNPHSHQTQAKQKIKLPVLSRKAIGISDPKKSRKNKCQVKANKLNLDIDNITKFYIDIGI